MFDANPDFRTEGPPFGFQGSPGRGGSGTMKFGFFGVDSLFVSAVLDLVRPKISEEKIL